MSTALVEPRKTRVFIATDIRLHGEGLTACLAPSPGLTIVGTGSCHEAAATIGQTRPQVLLVDLAAADSIKLPRIVPDIRVLAFGVTEAEHDLLACAEAGMCGYVARGGSIDDLVAAIHAAVSGELICSPRIAKMLFSRLAPTPRSIPATTLTAREREVAGLIAQGLSNKGIARSLSVEPPTVKNHVHNILQKLAMQRRGQIAALLHRPGPH